MVYLPALAVKLVIQEEHVIDVQRDILGIPTNLAESVSSYQRNSYQVL